MKLLHKILLIGMAMVLSSIVFADNNNAAAQNNQPIVNQTNIYYVYQPIPIVNPNQGWYIGGDVGTGSSNCNNCTFTFDNYGNILTESASTHNGSAFDIIAGFQFNRYIAIESSFGGLPGVSLVGTQQSARYSTTATSSAFHSYFALKGMYPLPHNFGLVGKLGYDMVSLNVSSNSNNYSYSTQPSGTLFSLGASYNMTPHWSAILAYNKILCSDSGSKYDFNYGTLGISYLVF